MAPWSFPVIGIAMLALTACDSSQNKPETIKAALPRSAAEAAQALPAPLAPVQLPQGHANVQSPMSGGASATGIENAAGERSIRLYGPGVSRKRQTRV